MKHHHSEGVFDLVHQACGNIEKYPKYGVKAILEPQETANIG